MSRIERVCRAQEGAIFVQTGIALFVLMAFNVFVLDYGVMWIARAQAQNAADAGALAGAIARGFDELDDPPHTEGITVAIAEEVAESNQVWQERGIAAVTFNCPAGVTGRCTRVEVFRDHDHGNAIETLFGPIIGVNSQNVRATSTAVTLNGNATRCLRPLAVPDFWLNNPSRPQDDVFQRYDESGGALLPTPDTYTPPSASYPGRTTVSANIGFRLIWSFGNPLTSPISRNQGENGPSLMIPLAPLGPGTFHDEIVECSGQLIRVGDTIPIDTGSPNVESALNHLMARDPSAAWNEGQNRIDYSCAPGCGPVSPRLVPIALFDPDRFQRGRATGNWIDVGCPSAHPCIVVANIVGFFVHGTAGSYARHGHFLKYPGLTLPTPPPFIDDGSWLVTTHLIR